MRRAARVDTNQVAIVDALRSVGAFVQPLHQVGQGTPDLLVSFRNVWYLIECKVGREPLTPDEADWHARSRAPVSIVKSPDDALALIGATAGAM